MTRAYKFKYVGWSLDEAIFCRAQLQQGGLRVWVKTDPKALDPSLSFARDISKNDHWKDFCVDLAVNNLDRLHDAEPFVRKSLENVTRK